MKATQQLHEAGQSLWLDNITRALLDAGTLAGYIADDLITGLTSNPTIFDKAIESSASNSSTKVPTLSTRRGKACWPLSPPNTNSFCEQATRTREETPWKKTATTCL